MEEQTYGNNKKDIINSINYNIFSAIYNGANIITL